jgi:transcriptional regulator with XRE-family HTH domain
MSAFEPLQVPASFWQRNDVNDALTRRDIGTLFQLLRQYAGASQQKIGVAVDLQQGSVSQIMNGERAVTRLDVLERIANGLAMPDDARILLGLAPRDSGVRRRTALGIGLVAAISPATLTAVLRESAAEAVEFTRSRSSSAVGSGVLDHLTTVIAGLDRAYPWQPATELFPLARAYRRYVERLLAGRHTLGEARELYVHGAYLSHILSDLAHDLGSTVAARAYANDANQLADQAGPDELCAWATDSLAVVLLHADQPRDAERALQHGLRRAPRRHPLAARLYARLALCRARRGNQAGTTDALTRARRRCDRLPAQMPSRLATDSADHTAHSITTYAASCHIDLRNWRQAETEARAALDVAKWSPGRAASAHLDLGTALAHLGSPDEAAAHGRQAFAHRVASGRAHTRATQLDAVLTARHPNEPAVKDFHDRYRQLTSEAITV